MATTRHQTRHALVRFVSTDTHHRGERGARPRSSILGRGAWRAGQGWPRARGSLSPLPWLLHLSTDALAPAVSHRISGGVGHSRGHPHSDRPRRCIPVTWVTVYS